MSKWTYEISIYILVYTRIFQFILKFSHVYFLVLYHTAFYRNGDRVDLIIYVCVCVGFVMCGCVYVCVFW